MPIGCRMAHRRAQACGGIGVAVDASNKLEEAPACPVPSACSAEQVTDTTAGTPADVQFAPEQRLAKFRPHNACPRDDTGDGRDLWSLGYGVPSRLSQLARLRAGGLAFQQPSLGAADLAALHQRAPVASSRPLDAARPACNSTGMCRAICSCYWGVRSGAERVADPATRGRGMEICLKAAARSAVELSRRGAERARYFSWSHRKSYAIACMCADCWLSAPAP
jgi:hypothetical protein